jgi:hypothetical protein
MLLLAKIPADRIDETDDLHANPAERREARLLAR